MAEGSNLHGNDPENAAVALLLIDVINDLEFEGGEKLFAPALAAAEEIRKLKQRAKAAGIPVIYVNDNFGRWQSNFLQIVERAVSEGIRGKPIAEKVLPGEDDYFILKPRHSGFYQTALDILLEYLQTRTLILTGFAGEICVLFTANDAYIRGYNVVIPSDCIASESERHHQQALELMERGLKARICKAEEIDLPALCRGE